VFSLWLRSFLPSRPAMEPVRVLSPTSSSVGHTAYHWCASIFVHGPKSGGVSGTVETFFFCLGAGVMSVKPVGSGIVGWMPRGICTISPGELCFARTSCGWWQMRHGRGSRSSHRGQSILRIDRISIGQTSEGVVIYGELWREVSDGLLWVTVHEESSWRCVDRKPRLTFHHRK
jgi:hypothetical protein